MNFVGKRLIAEVTYNNPLNRKYKVSYEPRLNYLTTKEWLKIIDSESSECDKIEFTGGEPLCRNDLEELIFYSKLSGYSTCLNTLCTDLTTTRVKNLKKCGLDTIKVNLESYIEYNNKYIDNIKDSGINFVINIDINNNLESLLNIGLQLDPDIIECTSDIFKQSEYPEYVIAKEKILEYSIKYRYIGPNIYYTCPSEYYDNSVLITPDGGIFP